MVVGATFFWVLPGASKKFLPINFFKPYVATCWSDWPIHYCIYIITIFLFFDCFISKISRIKNFLDLIAAITSSALELAFLIGKYLKEVVYDRNLVSVSATETKIKFRYRCRNFFCLYRNFPPFFLPWFFSQKCFD